MRVHLTAVSSSKISCTNSSGILVLAFFALPSGHLEISNSIWFYMYSEGANVAIVHRANVATVKAQAALLSAAPIVTVLRSWSGG